MSDEAGARSGGGHRQRLMRGVVALVLGFVALVAVAGISLTRQGTHEMSLSDDAFHSGKLRESVAHARAAALSYVPGSEHVRAANERLEAIARGAEAEGNDELALFAWDALRQAQVETSYPGRPKSELLERAEAGILRLRRDEEDF